MCVYIHIYIYLYTHTHTPVWHDLSNAGVLQPATSVSRIRQVLPLKTNEAVVDK